MEKQYSQLRCIPVFSNSEVLGLPRVLSYCHHLLDLKRCNSIVYNDSYDESFTSIATQRWYLDTNFGAGSRIFSSNSWPRCWWAFLSQVCCCYPTQPLTACSTFPARLSCQKSKGTDSQIAKELSSAESVCSRWNNNFVSFVIAVSMPLKPVFMPKPAMSSHIVELIYFWINLAIVLGKFYKFLYQSWVTLCIHTYIQIHYLLSLDVFMYLSN